MPGDRNTVLRQAALIRNLIETCLKASTSPMSGRELFDWPSISEQVGTSTVGYARFAAQLRRLQEEGMVEKIGQGVTSTYCWVHDRKVAPANEPLPDLKIRVDKLKRSVRLVFGGLNITIEVA